MYIGVCLNGVWVILNLFFGLLRGLLRGGKKQIDSGSIGLGTYTYIHSYINRLIGWVLGPGIGSKRLF